MRSSSTCRSSLEICMTLQSKLGVAIAWKFGKAHARAMCNTKNRTGEPDEDAPQTTISYQAYSLRQKTQAKHIAKSDCKGQ